MYTETMCRTESEIPLWAGEGVRDDPLSHYTLLNHHQHPRLQGEGKPLDHQLAIKSIVIPDFIRWRTGRESLEKGMLSVFRRAVPSSPPWIDSLLLTTGERHLRAMLTWPHPFLTGLPTYTWPELTGPTQPPCLSQPAWPW